MSDSMTQVYSCRLSADYAAKLQELQAAYGKDRCSLRRLVENQIDRMYSKHLSACKPTVNTTKTADHP